MAQTAHTISSEVLVAIAGIIVAFGAAMLFFRISRELEMAKKGEIVWLPLADWLLVIATMLSLAAVIVPLIFFSEFKPASAACGAAAVLLIGYVPAILGHYRIIFDSDFRGRRRSGPRRNPEPSELVFVTIALLSACAIFILRLMV